MRGTESHRPGLTTPARIESTWEVGGVRRASPSPESSEFSSPTAGNADYLYQPRSGGWRDKQSVAICGHDQQQAGLPGTGPDSMHLSWCPSPSPSLCRPPSRDGFQGSCLLSSLLCKTTLGPAPLVPQLSAHTGHAQVHTYPLTPASSLVGAPDPQPPGPWSVPPWLGEPATFPSAPVQ